MPKDSRHTLTIKLSQERDSDLIEWLDTLPEGTRNTALREVIRAGRAQMENIAYTPPPPPVYITPDELAAQLAPMARADEMTKHFALAVQSVLAVVKQGNDALQQQTRAIAEQTSAAQLVSTIDDRLGVLYDMIRDLIGSGGAPAAPAPAPAPGYMPAELLGLLSAMRSEVEALRADVGRLQTLPTAGAQVTTAEESADLESGPRATPEQMAARKAKMRQKLWS